MTTEQQVKGIIGQISRIRERANLLIERELHRANIEGILPAHGSVLYFLFQQEGPVAMKEIVEKVGRVKSTVTGMVTTLERYGYVMKSQSTVDGRVVLVELTDRGWAVRPVFEAISKTLQRKTYGNMATKDREKLAGLLVQVGTNLEG